MKEGDRVVCIKTHSQGLVSKGQEFTVTGSPVECKCKCITVGIASTDGFSIGEVYNCVSCHSIGVTMTNEVVFGAYIFRKIDTESFTNELTKELANKGKKDEFNKLQPSIKEKEIS